MFYKATFRENLGLCIVFGPFALFLLWIGLRSHETEFIVSGLSVAAFFLAMRLRLYVSCDEEFLEVRGFFRTRRIALAQITEVHRAEEAGYWASRFHGPSTYRFSTHADHLTINFKFFSRDCFREVMGRISSRLTPHDATQCA